MTIEPKLFYQRLSEMPHDPCRDHEQQVHRPGHSCPTCHHCLLKKLIRGYEEGMEKSDAPENLKKWVRDRLLGVPPEGNLGKRSSI